jgi:hypothetical protein
MRAELRRLHSPDVDDLATWTPPGDGWAILVQVLAGPAGGPGEESFDLTLCTPAWLAERAARDGVVDGRHHLVVAGYDHGRLLAYLRRRVAACEGDDWDEVGAKLGRLGRWEFEDYRVS